MRQLLAARRRNQRPDSVTVLVGQAPKYFHDTPAHVVVDRDLMDMDLSPLVGLPVHVIDLQNDAAVTQRVLAALEDLKVQPLGVCGPLGACGVSREHEAAMRRYREALCTTA